MNVVEAVRARLRKPERQWIGEEALEKMALLQGSAIDLLRVLRKRSLDHIHYGPKWHPEQPAEPESLSSAVSLLMGQPRKSGFEEIASLYGGYFARQGIVASRGVRIISAFPEDGVSSNFQVLMDYKQGDKWPNETTIMLFPWIDFSGELNLTKEAQSPEMTAGKEGVPSIYFDINTTRVEGNIYRVDIPTDPPGKITLSGLAGDDNIRDDGLEPYLKNDNFILTPLSQKLVTDLLAARV